MYRKKIVKIFFILFLLIIIFLIYIKYNKNEKIDVKIEQNNTDIYNSNIIKDVEYKTQDKNGNEYLIKSKKGEIDFSNPNIVFLTDVYALIKIKILRKSLLFLILENIILKIMILYFQKK